MIYHHIHHSYNTDVTSYNCQYNFIYPRSPVLINQKLATLRFSESTTEGDGLPPIEPVPGPSLGEILGLVALVITILYIIGMSWKVIKIFKGEYVPTEPVYLKYK